MCEAQVGISTVIVAAVAAAVSAVSADAVIENKRPAANQVRRPGF